MKKYLCCLLAGLMLLSMLVGCANTDQGGADTTLGEGNQEEDEASQALAKLQVDWDQDTFDILGREDYTPEELEVENQVEALEDAVYRRNLAFEEYCNADINVILQQTSTINDTVKKDVQANAGEFDLIQNHMANTSNLASDGFLVSFTAIDDIDLTGPWWDEGTASFVISDQIYFMNSAINYSDENTTYVMMFNKKMAEDEDIHPYQMVYDNEWTLDNFQSIIKEISYDYTGDGTWDENDVYGFVSTWETGSTFFFGSGLRYIVCEEGSDPYLALDASAMSKATDLLEKVLNIFYVNHSTYSSPPGKENLGMGTFKSGHALFYTEVVQYIVALGKDMEADFGVLPIPKYNKQQEDYITWTNGICTTASVSKAVQDLDKVGKTIEIFAIMSYQRVTPAFYDTVLQRKSVRDEESQGMLDIIFKTRTYDLCMYYDLGLEPLFKTCVNNNKPNFSSNYTKQAGRAQKSLDKLIKKFAKDE